MRSAKFTFAWLFTCPSGKSQSNRQSSIYETHTHTLHRIYLGFLHKEKENHHTVPVTKIEPNTCPFCVYTETHKKEKKSVEWSK